MPKEEIRRHFEKVAGDYDRWKEKSDYYYGLLTEIYRELVPPGRSVLEVGCGTGTLLSRLSPRRGVGVDISPRMVEIAAAKFPGLRFLVADAEDLRLDETFDFIVAPDVIEHLSDPGAMFRSVRRCCRPDSRVIVTCVNPLWAPILHLAERLGMKMPEGEHRWLPEKELLAIAGEAGFRVEAAHGRILCPKKIPVLAALLNRAAATFPSLKPLCLTQALVFIPA
jgi:ubiquinone/menaquinone biosynthesis C-methylase UbiE